MKTNWPENVKVFAKVYADAPEEVRPTVLDSYVTSFKRASAGPNLLRAMLAIKLIDLERRLLPEAPDQLLAHVSRVQQEATGLPISEYVGKKVRKMPPVFLTGQGVEGYYIGAFHEKPAYSNGYALILGTPPAFVPTQDTNFGPLEQSRMVMVQHDILPASYRIDDNSVIAKRRIYFDTGMMLDALYYDLMLTFYPQATFRGETYPQLSATLVLNAGEPVGLIMPLTPTA